MSKVTVYPSKISGNVRAISSKSHAHRMLIASSLADKKTVIKNDNTISEDIAATIECMRALGAKISSDDENVLEVLPINLSDKYIKETVLDCRESGTTLRFLLPLVSAISESASFIGRGKLPERPLDDLVRSLKHNGKIFSQTKMPFNVCGKLNSGEYVLPGDVSSQYVSGLMMALPLLEEDSNIRLTSPLQSAGYVGLTIDVLKSFGIEVQEERNGFHIYGGQRYLSPKEAAIEGDWSNSAFFLAAGALGEPIVVTDLEIYSQQGDKKILEILADFGAEVSINGNFITVKRERLCPISVDIANIPDLFPVLMILASVAEGKSRFTSTHRLRHKESDRILSVCEMLFGLGLPRENIAVYDNMIEITGGELLGGIVNSHNDHRIVMAATIASQVSKNAIIINGADAVAKSYPHFFTDFENLGGKINVDI